jgi:hypothetical protein
MSLYQENTPQTGAPQESPAQKPQFTTIRELDPVKVQELQERIQEEQNLSLGIMAGLAAALLGAILWGAISFFTNYQISWMAIGVAFMVGWSIRQFGKGVDKIYGFIGAGLALLSCLLGNFFMFVAVIAQEVATPPLDVLFYMILNPSANLELFVAAFSPIDLLFYGFAIYYGYQYSFRRLSAEEQEGLYRTRTVAA